MRILSIICLLALCAAFMNCGGDSPQPNPPPEPTEEEIMKEALTANGGTWGLGAGTTVVVTNGTNVNDVTDLLFEGFSIKFTDTGYTTTGDSPVWPQSDSWLFKTGTDGNVFVRNHDDMEVTIKSISTTELQLELEWDQTTYEEGRAKSTAGTHLFTLKK